MSNNMEKILDWIVALDLQHYKTEVFPDYTPSGASHFYLKRSPERFTSEEILLVFNNKASDELNERWNYAIVDSQR